jgi:hypothetical protein
MRVLSIAILLSAIQAPHQITIPSAPVTVTRQSTEDAHPKAPQILTPVTKTIPAASAEEMIHLNMEKDISGQGEALGQLKEKVGALEGKRENTDRPDIDGLKESRTYFLWIWGFITTVAATILGIYLRYGNMIWTDSIKPRLRRALVEIEPVNRN